MYLTPRLMKIASLVPQNSVMADVGTDHAYIPAHCIKKGICSRCVAMDINEGPLKNARETVRKEGISDFVELRLSDGMDKLSFGEVNTVVIAGMGGLLIKSIIARDICKIADGTMFILQPMLAQKELRKYLSETDIAISGEYLAIEGSKIYNIIVAVKGAKSDYCDKDIIIGRNVLSNSPDIYPAYIEKEINLRKKIIDGLNKAVAGDEKSLEEMMYELRILETEGKINEDK